MASSTPSRVFARSFASSPQPQTRAMEYLLKRHANTPAYPYPPQNWYKQANRGLYGRTRIQFGHNVSERNEIKTNRIWRPNIHTKRLWSHALGRWVRVKVQARVLRTVDKVGGLDEYLLGEKAARIKDLGMAGWALRWRVMQTPLVVERMRMQRIALSGGGGGGGGGELVGGSDFIGTGAVVPGESMAVGQDSFVSGQEGEMEATPEELQTMQQEIDRAMDEDAEREKQGVDGGIELGLPEQMDAETPARKTRKRW